MTCIYNSGLLYIFLYYYVARHKSGYLMFLEQKMFGSSWVRMYFAIKNGKLESPEVCACNLPVFLVINVCICMCMVYGRFIVMK